MALCVYKYVFNKHVIVCLCVWGGVRRGFRYLLYRGRPVFARGRGSPMSLLGPGQRPRGEGQGLSPPEASGN